MENTAFAQIHNTIQNYFNGIFFGDTEKLQYAFYEKSVLIGDINGETSMRNFSDYLDAVKQRKSPHELGERFKMKILGIELLGNNAIVKLHVPMLGYNYYDILCLSFINNQWMITHKLYTHVSTE